MLFRSAMADTVFPFTMLSAPLRGLSGLEAAKQSFLPPISLERPSSLPLYKQLYESIRQSILRGTLQKRALSSFPIICPPATLPAQRLLRQAQTAQSPANENTGN